MESGGVLAGSLHTTKHLLPSSSLLSPTHLLPSSKRHSSMKVHNQLPFSNSNLRLVSSISKRQVSTALSSAISKAHFMKVCAWFPHEGCCNSTLLENNHPCVEGAMHHACPICFEYLFESTNDGSVLPCGHTMHVSCLKEI